MNRQVLRHGQITLPKEVIRFFNIKEHDLLEIKFDRSGIYLKPAVSENFSDQEYDKLARKLDALKKVKGRIYESPKDAKDHLRRLSKPD